MRRRLWTDEEIRDILVAIGQAGSTSLTPYTPTNEEQAQAIANYCQGFRAALISLAHAFGLEPYQGSRDR